MYRPGGVLGEQVRPGQHRQRPTRLGRRQGREAGGCRDGHVGAGVRPEHPEQVSRRRVQPPVRPRQHRPHVAAGPTVAERVQGAPGGGQLGGEPGEGEVRVGRGPRGHERQRQRQPGRRGDDPVRRLRLRRDPLRTQPAGQQLVSLRRGQQVQRQRAGTLGGDQPRQLVAAGHQDQAARRAGQQRPHLVGVTGVVQQHQHAPVGEQAAVERGLRRQPHGYALRGHRQRLQEPGHRLGRGQRGRLGVVPAQVDVELAVGEPVGDLVRPVHGEGGLAHPGRTADGRDRHGARRAGRLGEQCGQGRQRRGPAGEVPYRRG